MIQFLSGAPKASAPPTESQIKKPGEPPWRFGKEQQRVIQCGGWGWCGGGGGGRF